MHLDFGNQVTFLRTISKLRAEGLAVIFTFHIPDHAFAVADHTMFLSQDASPVSGPSREMLTEEIVSRAYAVPVEISRSSTSWHAAPRLRDL